MSQGEQRGRERAILNQESGNRLFHELDALRDTALTMNKILGPSIHSDN